MKKNDINPMQSAHLAKRCSAHSKRTGAPCGSPAVKGWNVCRMHGAGGGAPVGEGNGRYRDGVRSRASMAEMACLKVLISQASRWPL